MQRLGSGIRVRSCLTLLALCAVGCARGQEYELRGQILAVDPSRQEITVKHEDIRGFMPAMTMPFKVRNASLLEGRLAGELIRATLVVEDARGYLRAIESVGHAPLTEAPAPPRRPILDAGDPVPDVPLVDEAGRTRTLSAWRNQTIAVTFIYTHCPIPDFCPALDRRFADVQDLILRDPALRGRARLLSVSIDPKTDTPAVLMAHARKLGANPEVWTFLTGDTAQVDDFASAFGVHIMRDSASPEVLHNLRTGVIDGDGRVVSIHSGNDWRAADLAAALKQAGATRSGSTSGGR
jgi:protein SCO1/2